MNTVSTLGGVERSSSFVADALRVEPMWPGAADGPFLFLLDASSEYERSLMEGWIGRHRPPDVRTADVASATIPSSRRPRFRRRNDPRLEPLLADPADPLLVPLRVVWMPPEREGVRSAAWADVLAFGDPRDPDFIRQRVIHRRAPDRVAIVAGQAARASELRERWQSPGGRSRLEGASFGEFVALQAWLALERAERGLRGNRYKVPKFLREDLFESPRFVNGIARLAREHDATFEQMARRTYRYLKEMAASHSPFVIDLVAAATRWLIGRAYSGLHYDKDELDRLYAMSERSPLVFLPSHKSNFDHLALQYVLYVNSFPPNHTAGGINMNFFPVGPLLRRTGIFFIRREFKDNEPYKFVLRRYLEYLLEKRFPLEWYIEGGRSRTGKLRPPRFGMLAYVVEAYRNGASDDVVLIPVSIAYDQIQDIAAYAAEQRGEGKERESFGWLVKSVRNLKRRYGAIHLRFGETVSLRDELGAPQPDDVMEGRDLEVPKLAFEVATRINEATPITPISLVTLALLTAGGRALTVEQTLAVLEPFLDYVKRRELPITVELALDTPERVRRALDDLTEHGVVARFEGATDVVYRVDAERHLSAAYYRNTIIHFFVNGAIAELAVVAVAESSPGDPVETVFDEALALRDLLKFEFFFSPRSEFRAEISTELELQEPSWEERLRTGEAREVLLAFRPFRSPAVLRPFLEAYRVVGDLMEAKAYQSNIDATELAKEALKLGEQYRLQGRIRTGESVSSVIIDAAIGVALNRRLLGPSPDMIERRQAFAAELRELLHRLDVIEALEAGRAVGVFD